MINNKNKNKLVSFLNIRGYYLVLIICLTVITLTAFIVTRNNIASYMEDNSFGELVNEFEVEPYVDERLEMNINKQHNLNISEEIGKIDVKSEEINKKTISKNSDTTDKNEVPEKVNQDNIIETLATNIDNIVKLQMPVFGDVIKPFSQEDLIYSNTLDQWVTHNGIDIGAERGTPINAACDGTVEKIYIDDKYGITIIVRHNENYKTKYSNLSTDKMVQEGLEVKKGDVISGIGNTSLFESSDKPHLHFEVLCNNVNVNPSDYLE